MTKAYKVLRNGVSLDFVIRLEGETCEQPCEGSTTQMVLSGCYQDKLVQIPSQRALCSISSRESSLGGTSSTVSSLSSSYLLSTSVTAC